MRPGYERSRGAIRVHSRPRSGSTFDVYLPATQPAAPRAIADATGPRARVEAARGAPLVDDDDLVHSMAVRVLSQAGYRVTTANSARQALQLIERRESAIDLLVTDVIMPGYSGVELALQARRRSPELPILYMSGYATEVLAREGLHDVVDGFVAKPFTPESLCSAVRASLTRGAAREAAG